MTPLLVCMKSEIQSMMHRAIKPGNGQLCGSVPLRLVNSTGLSYSFLGNCSELPVPLRRALPPAAGLNATLVAPAPVSQCSCAVHSLFV